jgi:hypothetical protein
MLPALLMTSSLAPHVYTRRVSGGRRARYNADTHMERKTIGRIREAVRSGRLNQPFRAADVNRILGIDWARTFLPKHAVDNPGGFTELFVRIGRGLYAAEVVGAHLDA